MATRTPEWSVQVAIYAALAADAALDTFVSGRIYDYVPQNVTAPYITIGDTTVLEWDTKTTVGEELTTTIHVWSEYEGRMECKQIQGEIVRILHNNLLTITGHRTVLVRREYSDTTRDPNGATWHGVSRFRVIVQEQ